MKLFTRLALILFAVILSAGPLTAASVTLTNGAHIGAPSTAAPSRLAGAVEALGYLFAFGMAIKVKDISAVADKYVKRASVAGSDYTAGVQAAGADWETGAKNGEGNFEQGIQDAIQRKAYGKGVSGSAAKYTQNAVKLGAVRYGPGVANGAGAYQAGVQPYLDKLRSLNLPPKGPRRSPANQQRANMVAAELGKLKTGV